MLLFKKNFYFEDLCLFLIQVVLFPNLSYFCPLLDTSLFFSN